MAVLFSALPGKATTMKRLFLFSVFAAALAVASFNAQAAEPSVFQVAESTVVSAAAESDEATIEQFHGQRTSFTSSLSETPACGAGSCGAGDRTPSQACDGGSADSLGGCPLFSDEPLLGFLKNQQIGDCWTVSVGGQLRYRYMNEDNRLRPGGPGKSTYDLWRFTPHIKLQQGDAFTAYVEAIDASIFNEELPVTGIDENRSDLLQVYGDFKIAEGDEGTLRGRVGRQFLKYGTQHLVSPLAWSNTFRNFEGVRL